ncbi:testis-expressed protein 9 [Protobothrops mucrosquamatus]|uniref:testis-expressed protein 9 n=1 Tax=Protobothrops mucrosquamatus TaxID=103944 RepID=UPI000775E6B7|nr:testis-expressed protein 9 [Protobothrops mucrosquamatus]
MAADGQPAGEQPPRPRSAAPLIAREEEYRRLNAALEAKAAAVMSQAEQLMRDRREALARPASARGDALEEAAAAALAAKESDINSPEPPVPLAQNKQLHKKKAGAAPTIRGRPLTGRKGKRPLLSIKSRLQVDSSNPDVAAPGCSLTKLIGRIEGQLEEGNLPDLEDNLIPSTGSELGAEAQIRFLKAKLRVMQEELDAIGQECSKKDEENENVSSHLKEVEEERGRLQRAASLHQSQVEKYKLLSEEANRKSESLQQKLSMLEKELENLKRAQKQAAATQGTTDIRLNRALEEAEKYKMELNKLKQSNKDVVNQEHKKLEELKIENKRLEKQKEELVAGFKKQLKLTDILKRQKMHIESAKMLSFTEEEFMKALEWGNP